jgi:hypothetical protein
MNIAPAMSTPRVGCAAMSARLAVEFPRDDDAPLIAAGEAARRVGAIAMDDCESGERLLGIFADRFRPQQAATREGRVSIPAGDDWRRSIRRGSALHARDPR